METTMSENVKRLVECDNPSDITVNKLNDRDIEAYKKRMTKQYGSENADIILKTYKYIDDALLFLKGSKVFLQKALESKEVLDKIKSEFSSTLETCLLNHGSDYAVFKKKMDDFMKNYKSAYDNYRNDCNCCLACCEECLKNSKKYKAFYKKFSVKAESQIVIEKMTLSLDNEDISLDEMIDILNENDNIATDTMKKLNATLDADRKSFREDTSKLKKVEESVRVSQASNNKKKDTEVSV